MLVIKFLFLVIILLLGEGCDSSCTEKGENSIICDTFSDLDEYPEPEKRLKTFIQVAKPDGNRPTFSCTSGRFSKFPLVEFFNLSDISVNRIHPHCFEGMNNLKTIDLSYNILTEIDMITFRVSDNMKIRKIFLQNNQILDIKLTGPLLPDLHTLNLKNNSLTSIYIQSTNIPKIRYLNVQGNDIWRFGIESQTLTNLDMSHNCIRTFTKEHLVLPHLKHLNLAGNHLTVINAEMFNNMPKLQYLYLSQNFLNRVSLPNHQLVHIDLNYNLLKIIEYVEVKFVKHSSIHLNFNKFFELTPPSSFGDLTEFVCNFCNIHSVDPYFVYDLSPTMESLSLRSNLLTAVRFESRNGNLSLVSIDLTYNSIKRINRMDFYKLTKVINLYLGNNEIVTIAPGSFDRMTMLHTLDLSNNFIFDLPPNVFDQIPLVWLLLNGNNLAYFPIPGWNNQTKKIAPNTSKLNNLQLLNIENNPFQCDCLEYIHLWAQKNAIELNVYDTKVKAGEKPACIVNDHGCQINVGKDFVREYWHLFNDNKIRDILDLQDD